MITALGVGGAEHMLLKLLGAPAMAGIEQRVVALLPGGALADTLRQTGGPVQELNFLGAVPVLRGAWDLVHLARQQAPDLVHGWLYHGNLGAWLARAALPRRVPLVWSVRQSLPSLQGENAFARVGIRWNRRWSSRPDCLLFNSQQGMRQHQDFGFDMRKARYLPNGFDVARFSLQPAARTRLRAQWGVADGEQAVGLLARYHPVKDHAGFLRAVQPLMQARPGLHVVLAGPGVDAQQPALVQDMARLGLGPRVHLLGDRRDTPDVLSALDVLVSSSRAEAFSNVIGEAMACGLPCVVTEVGDSAALVADTGFSVPPGDPAALGAALQRLLDLPQQARAAMGQRARARIESDFSLDVVATRHAALLAELTARGT